MTLSSPKFLLRLFSSLSVVVLVVTMALSFHVVANAHAAGFKSIGTARFFSFSSSSSKASSLNVAASQLQHWTSSFTFNGKTYQYSMVGTNPAQGSATTTIPVTIVPLILTFSHGHTFDGTKKVQNTTASPIFQPAQFISGNTQFGDAIQRAEFWNSVSTKSPNYHVLLGAPTVNVATSLRVPSSVGSTKTASNGEMVGLVSMSWFDTQIRALLVKNHFTSNMLPIFLTYNVFLYQGSASNCCIIGYHNAVSNSAGLQTYLWASNNDPGIYTVPIEDISALSHETSEWLNDPFTNNFVPPWNVPSQPQYGCTNTLETGDPLVGVSFTVNGYHPQDEAFFSWFARQTPSIAINGLYTYLGTFKTYSPHC
jgi:hypothetical protein